ncbi:MAG: class I SAM-dependent methyltransferase [Bradymonadaceae bacterium]|nr:class I SAM-dependent methyltransferase [Lujinxingiaceae bacterium]
MSPLNTLQFRVPEELPACTLEELIRRAWPEGTPAQLSALFAELAVKIDGELTRKPAATPIAGALITVGVPEGEEVYGLPDAVDLARGDGWVIVDKPIGMPGEPVADDPMDPVLFLADMLGLERDTFRPAWTMPTTAGGPWLFGLDDATVASLRRALVGGDAMMTWTAIIARPPMPRGRWSSPSGVAIEYMTTTARGGLCEVQLIARFEEAASMSNVALVEMLLETLSRAGYPVLGDRERGGHMVAGGLRLRLAAIYQESGDLAYSWPMPGDWWPDQPVAPVPEAFQKAKPVVESGPRQIPKLGVSAKTLEVLASQGHPWVLEDAQIAGRAHLPAGSLVELSGPNGEQGPFALIEGPGTLAARVWSKRRDEAEDFDEEVDIRVDEAIARRADFLRTSNTTNTFRLIHGEADGLPGFYLDRMGSILRATLAGGSSMGFKDRVYHNLVEHDPEMIIVEVPHLRDVREGESLPIANLVHRGAGYLKPGEHVVALEDGLRYRCEPWEGIDVGFFADQRDNRRKLAALASSGQRWLNLFCHTGAFTVALAARGAHVTSVDLSRRYLSWLEESLAMNQLPANLNTSIAADCRDYLRDSDERFDGMIVDPPTAAAGSGAFWSVRKDYEKLLTACFGRLEPGGTMLVCRNDRKRTPTLETVVRAAADAAGWKIARVEGAPPAGDYPRLRGFTEGDSFEGLLVYGR